MSLFDSARAWWRTRQTRLSDQLLVEFNESTATVRVLRDLDPQLNQTFAWADIRRVCFVDGGLYSTDLIHIFVEGREGSIVIPIEARGGTDFFGAVCERGLFPESVWRKTIADTSGGTHCWPPHAS